MDSCIFLIFTTRVDPKETNTADPLHGDVAKKTLKMETEDINPLKLEISNQSAVNKIHLSSSGIAK